MMGVDRDPRRWAAADKCVLWLAVWQLVYVPYLFRTSYLLRHPDVEPYFDRAVLSGVRIALLGFVFTSLALMVTAKIIKARDANGTQPRWLAHAVNQMTSVWIVASAYLLGPVTSPILALLIVATFLSAQLFSRAVVLSALLTAVALALLLTVAERLELLPYAPLFTRWPMTDGRLADAYVFGTALASMAIISLSGGLVIYLVGQRRAREAEFEVAAEARQRANADLERALDSLQESEEVFRQLAENTREVFWMIDRDSGKLLYLGPAFEAMWGIPTVELFDRMDTFLRAIHPEDVQRLTERFSRLNDAMATERGSEVDYRILRPDGEVRWIAIRTFPIRDGDGRLYRLGGLMEDVTDRKRTESALLEAHAQLERRVAERTAALSEANERLMLEATERTHAEGLLRESREQLRRQFAELEQLYRTAPIGLALHDTSLRYVRINERLAAINGRPVEDHIGRTLREVLPEISGALEPLLNRVIESGEPALDREVRGSTPAEPDIERRWMTSYYPLKAETGRVLGVSAVVLDISERVWAEERARRHLEDLAHVSRLSTMGEMAAGIAHELNQPLMAMANLAFIGLHRLDGDQGEKSAELRRLFADLSDQALRAGEIVQHLRAFVRKSDPQRERLAVNDLIGDVLTLMEAEMRQHGVQAKVELSSALLDVNADAIQVQQVVLNLLRNALEAMAETPAEGRRLTITTTAQRGGFAEVAVADTGPGLTGTVAARVFDAFFTTKREGMGMGLAISRSIIEDHGGRLWAEARAGEGAIFRFTLPLAGGARDNG